MYALCQGKCVRSLEGRVQRGQLAVYPPGDAREDWKILRALSGVLGKASAEHVGSSPLLAELTALLRGVEARLGPT